MKTRYIPLEKRSKREQREYHAKQRRTWGDLNPVTRSTPNLKAYNRKKSRQWFEHEPSPGFLILPKTLRRLQDALRAFFNCPPILSHTKS